MKKIDSNTQFNINTDLSLRYDDELWCCGPSLGLNYRTRNIFVCNDVITVSQLMALEKKDIYSLDGVGEKTAQKIFEIMDYLDEIQNIQLTTSFENIMKFINLNEFETLPVPEFLNHEAILFYAKHFPTVKDVLQLTHFSAIEFTMSYKAPNDISIIEIIKVRNILMDKLSIKINMNHLPISKEHPHSSLYRELVGKIIRESVSEENVITSKEAELALADALSRDMIDIECIEFDNALNKEGEQLHNYFSTHEVPFIEELTGVKNIIDVTPDDLLKLNKDVLERLNYFEFFCLIESIEDRNLLIKPKEILKIDDYDSLNALIAYLEFFQYKRTFNSKINAPALKINIKSLVHYLTISDSGFARLRQIKEVQKKKLSEGIEVKLQPDQKMIKQLQSLLIKNDPHEMNMNIIELINYACCDNGVEQNIKSHLDLITLFQLGDELAILINTLKGLKNFQYPELFQHYEVIFSKWSQIMRTIYEQKKIKTSELYQLYGISGNQYNSLFRLAISLKIINRKNGCFFDVKT